MKGLWDESEMRRLCHSHILFLSLSHINMTNLIKQRKITPIPDQSIIHLDSNVMEDSKIHQSHGLFASYPGNCVGLVLTTLGVASLILAAASVLMRPTPSLRSSSKYLHPEKTSKIETAEGELLSPLSKFLESMGSRQSVDYGRTTPTGTYSLGVEYLLHKTSASPWHSGTIQFPHVDLSSLLAEEASDFVGIMMIPFGQQKQSASLLADRPTFNSVIFDKSKNTLPSIRVERTSLTRKGYKPGNLPNQDRSIIVNLVIPMGSSDGDPQTTALLMGIFDGHGARGHEVSHYLALEFPRVFTRIIREKQNTYIGDALTETFLEVDAKEPVKGTAGSTASVLFYPGSGSKVYIANAGDSTTIICSYSKTNRKSAIMYQNRKHKPHLPDERQRIESSGGKVMIPQSLLLQGSSSKSDSIKETSRVIIPSADGNPFSSLALAMSRSIGDWDGKRVGITAIPEIDVWDVNDHFDREQQADTRVSIQLSISVSFPPCRFGKLSQLASMTDFCNICVRWIV